MDEHGRNNNMPSSLFSHTFEDDLSFNQFPTNLDDGGLTAWLFPQNDNVPPTSNVVEHNVSQNPPPPADVTPQPNNNNSSRPRGRPPGSKNKPKPSVFITQENDHGMKPMMIEVAAGFDVAEALVKYANLHNAGISVLSATGSVASVTLHHVVPRSSPITLHGPFTLLSLTGTYISAGNFSDLLTVNHHHHFSSRGNSFGITLSGSQAEIFGGIVAGKVVACSTVSVAITVFKNPEFFKVGSTKENSRAGTGAGAGSGSGSGSGAGTRAGFGVGAGAGAGSGSGPGVGGGSGSGVGAATRASSGVGAGAGTTAGSGVHAGATNAGGDFCSSSGGGGGEGDVRNPAVACGGGNNNNDNITALQKLKQPENIPPLTFPYRF